LTLSCTPYFLTGNHYHLVIETPQASLPTSVRQLNGAYTQAFNRRHDKVSHLPQGRFKSNLVDRHSYLFELCRYVVLNPMRARIARKPDSYCLMA